MTQEEEQMRRWKMACESELRRDERQRRFHGKVLGLAWAALLAALGVGGCLSRLSTVPVHAEAEASPPTLWATDGAEDSGAAIARPMPAKPFEGQKKPPCSKPAGQVEINGGCWLALEVKPEQVPGCGADYFEHGGKCYLPVKQAQRPPTSVSP